MANSTVQIYGYSGFSGYSGAGGSGFSGYSGAGGSGFSGYSGVGISGFSGYSGAGLSGFSGYSGSKGADGGTGASGFSGYSGLGLSGFSGYSGAGLSGFSGYSGALGSSGYSGYSGSSNVRLYTWVISSPAVAGIPGPRLKESLTATRIDSYVTAATSVVFNIEERSTIGSTGTDLLSADQTATTTGATTTTFADSALAADNWLWLDISAVNGTPGNVVVTLSCTVP